MSGLANPDTGWGIKGDTFSGLEMLGRLGEPSWFWLGDRDLATHITRTRLLREGKGLTEVTAALAEALEVRAHLLPMSDETVETMVDTPDGELAFQEYFVHRGCRDLVLGLRFAGLDAARPTAAVLSAIEHASALVICPSNPYVSVGPILALQGVRDLMRQAGIADRGRKSDHRRAGRTRAGRPDAGVTGSGRECLRRGQALRGFSANPAD